MKCILSSAHQRLDAPLTRSDRKLWTLEMRKWLQRDSGGYDLGILRHCRALPPSLLCVCAGNWYRVSLEITNLKKKRIILVWCARSTDTCTKWNQVRGDYLSVERWRRHYTHYYCCVRKCEPCLSTYENDFPGSYSYMSCHVGRRRPTRARAQYTA